MARQAGTRWKQACCTHTSRQPQMPMHTAAPGLLFSTEHPLHPALPAPSLRTAAGPSCAPHQMAAMLDLLSSYLPLLNPSQCLPCVLCCPPTPHPPPPPDDHHAGPAVLLPGRPRRPALPHRRIHLLAGAAGGHEAVQHRGGMQGEQAPRCCVKVRRSNRGVVCRFAKATQVLFVVPCTAQVGCMARRGCPAPCRSNVAVGCAAASRAARLSGLASARLQMLHPSFLHCCRCSCCPRGRAAWAST